MQMEGMFLNCHTRITATHALTKFKLLPQTKISNLAPKTHRYGYGDKKIRITWWLMQQNVENDTEKASRHVKTSQTKCAAQTKPNWSILVSISISFRLLVWNTKALFGKVFVYHYPFLFIFFTKKIWNKYYKLVWIVVFVYRKYKLIHVFTEILETEKIWFRVSLKQFSAMEKRRATIKWPYHIKDPVLTPIRSPFW